MTFRLLMACFALGLALPVSTATAQAPEPETPAPTPGPSPTAPPDAPAPAAAPPDAPAPAAAPPDAPAPAAAPPDAPAPAAAPPDAPAPSPPPAPEPVPEPEPLAEPAPEPEAEAQTPSLSVGVGLRAGVALDADGNSADPTVTPAEEAQLRADQINVRPYFSGQIHENVAFEANIDGGTGGVNVLDAVVKLQFHDLFNVWMGQFLAPSSRANLSGPYYQSAWNFPLFVQAFPFDYAGRDRGLAFWGQVGKGRFKYQVGAFDLEPGNPVKNARLAARLVANFLEPEPGYYNSSTYFGGKDVLALGATIQAQDAVDSVDVDGDGMDDGTGGGDDSMLGLQLDVLFEKNLDASGVLSLEGSLWIFDTDAPSMTSAGYLGNPFNGGPPIQFTGNSFFVLASWMTPEKVGIGNLQPTARLQWVEPDDVDSEVLVEGGLNYIIDGHNNRFHVIVGHNTATEGTSVQAGTQVQMW